MATRPEASARDTAPSVPAGPGRPGQRANFAVLASIEFRWLLASNLAFFYAMFGQMLVRPLLAWELTHSKLALGYASFLAAVPMLLVAPFGGVIADRFDRRSVIAAAQSVLLLSELVMLGLVLSGNLAFWHILASAFLMGCLLPFILPARMAIVVGIVGKKSLGSAMALSSMGMSGMQIAAPALAASLVGPLGMGGVYSIAVVLFAMSLTLLVRVQRRPPERSGGGSVGADLLYGLSYFAHNRVVLAVAVFGMLPPMLGQPVQALLVAFAEEVWQSSETAFGLLQATVGIGGVGGAWLVARRGENPQRMRPMLLAGVGFGVLVAAFAFSPNLWIGLVVLSAAFACASGFGVLATTTVQLLIPEAVRGRISGLMMMTSGMAPLATLPVTALADGVGAPSATAIASLILILAVLAMFASSASLRTADGAVVKVVDDEVAFAEAAAGSRG